ncbi:uncharacterized protein LOC135698931 [Ochlerotatus camptorhynchus]|uniref:uncharacterized protein LOC135698931 n=1 Tax=Ochlerotatus camptorhynchus TaxID=644619 RepID=UPI0031CE9ACC
MICFVQQRRMMDRRSCCITGPTSSASFNGNPVDVLQDASNTTWPPSPPDDVFSFDLPHVQLFAAAILAVTRRPRLRYDEADWKSYGATFQSLLQQRNPDSIESLTEAINAAASATIPKISSIPGRKALRWWNEETKKAVKARRKALRRVKRLPIDDPDMENALCIYRERHNQCRQLCSAELWGKVNALSDKRRTATLHIQVDGAAVSDSGIVADKLGDYFADLSAISKYEATFQRLANPSNSSVSSFRVSPDRNNLRINHDFTWQELQFALSRSNGKSAGPDEIGYPLLKNLPIPGKVKMLELFNQLGQTDSYPEHWRESLIVPIPKANEPTRDVAKLRPIAFTCCMAKVFERMVNRRLKQFLESGGFLDHCQHAFRQGHGTSTYFATLGALLKDAKDNRLHTELVSLDIAKTFNPTWMPAVLKQLVSWGLSGHIIHFV